jgi:hypothetical protein
MKKIFTAPLFTGFISMAFLTSGFFLHVLNIVNSLALIVAGFFIMIVCWFLCIDRFIADTSASPSKKIALLCMIIGLPAAVTFLIGS